MNHRWLVWSAAAVAVGLAVTAGVFVFRPRPHWRDEGFQSENPAIRADAIRRLPPGSDRRQLIDRLKDEDADVRLLAAQRLAGSGPDGAERARALIPLLGDKHAGVRREAACSLRHINPEALPALQQALADENPRVRAGAALALGDTFGSKMSDPWPAREAQALVPALSQLVNDPDPEVSRHAKGALGCIRR